MESVYQNPAAAHGPGPSGFVSETYRCYKSHTEAFLTWLAGQVGPQQFASTQDYVLAAERLREAQPLLRMPQGVLNHLQDAISLRRDCTAYYKARSLPDFSSTHGSRSGDIESQGHRHFTSVLEKVKYILSPAGIEDQTTPSNAQATRGDYVSQRQQQNQRQDPPTPENQNLFEYLTVQNTAQEDSTFPLPQKIHLPTVQPPTQSGVDQIMSMKEDDALLAMYCLVDDLNHIKSSIVSMWEEYRDQKLSLMKAAVTSNTLLRYAEHLETSFYLEYRDIICEEQLLEHILLRSPKQGKAKVNVSCLSDEDFPRVVLDHLNGWRLSNDNGVLVPDGSRKDIPDTTGSNPMQVRRARQVTFLRELLLEYRMLFAVYWFPFAVDQVAQAFLRLTRGDKVSLWMVVSVQMLIEIKQLLGPDVSRGLSEMQSSARNVVATLDEYERFESRLELTSILLQQRKSGELTRMNIDNVLDPVRYYVLDDGISRIKEICFPPSLSALIGPQQKYFLLANHPILCGQYEFRMKTHFQNITRITIKWQDLLLRAVHLHNAFSIDNGLQPRWERMEDLLRVWGKESFFFGGKPPLEFDKAYRHLWLKQGAPLDALAPTSHVKRELRGRISLQTPRVFNIFRYTPSFDHLIAFFYGEQGVEERPSVEHFRLLLVNKAQDQKGISKSQDDLSGPLAFKEQLNGLFVANEERLNFNLMYMYRLCARLLRHLAARSADAFKWRREYQGGFELWRHSIEFPHWVLEDINSTDLLTKLSGASKLEDARNYISVFVGVVERLEASGYLPNFTHRPVTEETCLLKADDEGALNAVTKDDGPTLRVDKNTDVDVSQKEIEHPTSNDSASVGESAARHTDGSEVHDVTSESVNPLVRPHKVVSDEPGWKRYYFPRINSSPTAAKRAEIKAGVQALYVYDASGIDDWVESTVDRIWAYRGAEEA